MGTSSNHPSPPTPTWQPVNAALGRPNVPPDRQSSELWRAAIADRDGQLKNDLSNPLIAQACRIAGAETNPAQAVTSFDSAVAEQYEAGLTYDMAKRALARAVATGSGSEGFASELFAESVSYYASRDLPSLVAAPGRIRTTSDSIALKEKLRSIARDTAKSAQVSSDPHEWRMYVDTVLSSLSGRMEAR